MLGLAPRLVAASFTAAVLLVGLPLAQASHYRLPVADFISSQESSLLLKAGVRTTLGLLQEVGTAAQRAHLSGVTGLSSARIDELACHVDLLRLDGVGPSMVRLMAAAGVRHTRALKGESAASLHARMAAINQTQRIAPVLPPEGLVAAWVAAAGRLPQVIDGLP